MPVRVLLNQREQRVFPDHRQQVPHEQRVAPCPAGFSRQHLLSVGLIQGELAAEVADMWAVRLFEVEIAQGELSAIGTALGLQYAVVVPLPVQRPQLSTSELHLEPLQGSLHLLAQFARLPLRLLWHLLPLLLPRCSKRLLYTRDPQLEGLPAGALLFRERGVQARPLRLD